MYFLSIFSRQGFSSFLPKINFNSVASNLYFKSGFKKLQNYPSLPSLPALICRGGTRWYHIDRSKVPKLLEGDLEECFVRGSGPGGSNVNTNSNCVVLKHIPTGLVVKCHESRLLEKNRSLAREKMITKLDNHYNGDLSVEAQIKARDLVAKSKRDAKARKHRELKQKWKENNLE